MKNLLICALAMYSLSALATGTTRSVQVLTNVLKSEILQSCEKTSDSNFPVTYRFGSCTAFNKKAISIVDSLIYENMNQIIFESDKDQQITKAVNEDLTQLLTDIKGINEEWRLYENLTLKNSALIIKKFITMSIAKLNRSDVMNIKCVTPRNEMVLSASIFSDKTKKSSIILSTKRGLKTLVVNEVIYDNELNLSKPSFAILTDGPMLNLEGLININGEVKSLANIANLNGEGLNLKAGDGFDLRCSLIGSGY